MSSAAAAAAAAAVPLFAVKRVVYGRSERCILMQDANGPCPLLALANGLLLLGRLRVPDFAAVDAGWLAGELAAYVRARGTTAAAAEQANVAQQVADVGGVLPALARGVGLDVNPYFASAEAFEYTGALSLMDLCGLRLLHGLVLCNAWR